VRVLLLLKVPLLSEWDLIVVYYFRARELGVSDPLLEFSIGLAYLHRAMQRQADNRHILILQGMTFIFQYYRSYYEHSHSYPDEGAAMRQQAEYNVGRAFHQLGLTTYAIWYYEKVIKISGEMGGLGVRDLVYEGVHNLCLIYAMAGNMAAAKVTMEKYLVI
jgi:general transcription factor 3C polypeptide 3 (transcription factor C subunit 4)